MDKRHNLKFLGLAVFTLAGLSLAHSAGETTAPYGSQKVTEQVGNTTVTTITDNKEAIKNEKKDIKAKEKAMKADEKAMKKANTNQIKDEKKAANKADENKGYHEVIKN